MRTIEKSITVMAPVDVAYAAWRNFKNFPAYTPHVLYVEKLDKTATRWTVDVLGYRIQFEAELDEDVPNRFISWHSVSTIKHFGSAMFDRAGGGVNVTVRILFDTTNLSTDLIEDLDVQWSEFEGSFEEALDSFKRYVEQMWRLMPTAM